MFFDTMVSNQDDHPIEWQQKLLSTVGKYGIISQVFCFLKHPEDFPVHIYGADLNYHGRMELAEAAERLPGSGVGLSRDDALSAALGEAIERYCFATAIPKNQYTSAWPDFKNETFALRQLPFLLPKEQSVDDFFTTLAKRRINWIDAFEVSENGKAKGTFLVPVMIVFGSYSDERLIVTTNGMGCGTSEDMALLKALYELIERDAVMISWFHQYPGSLVRIEEVLPKKVVQMVKQMRKMNINFYLRDITTDIGLPVFLGFAIRLDGGDPVSFACGASAGLDVQSAATKAFLEVCLSWRGANDLMRFRKPMRRMNPVPDPVDFSDHLYLYQHPWMMKGVDFLLQKDKESSVIQKGGFSSISDQLEQCINLLNSKGYKVLKVDMTTPDVDQFGLKVVRAIVPGLVPLFVGIFHAFYNQRLNVAAHIPEEKRIKNGNFNPYPHPFP